MYYFNLLLNKLFGLLLSPFQALHPFWPLLFISLLTGILMLLVFRYTSNQTEIRKIKDRIKAHLLEMYLFKDDLIIITSAVKNILIYNAKYVKHLIKPMLFLIVPMVIMLIHLNLWFGYRPIRMNEASIFSVKISDQGGDNLSKVEIEVDRGIIVETPPLRILEKREVNWRIRANKLGTYTVKVKALNQIFQKRFVVSENRLTQVSPQRVVSRFWDTLLNPGEKPIKKNSPVEVININYPQAQIDVFGWRMHWLIVFFVLSMVVGFVFKGFLRVEI